MTFLKDSAVSGHKSINYESPIFQEHIQLSNSHGIFTPCLMNLKENIIEIYSNDYMKKKKLLYRFEVDKVNIQPNMSLKGFFISTNKDNLEILSEKTKYILRAIEVSV